jgi:hypothetical protein
MCFANLSSVINLDLFWKPSFLICYILSVIKTIYLVNFLHQLACYLLSDLPLLAQNKDAESIVDKVQTCQAL